MKNNVMQDKEKQAFRTQYQDGMAEIVVGVFFAIIGLALWSYQRALAASQYVWLFSLGLLAIALIGVFATNRGLAIGKRQVAPSASDPGEALGSAGRRLRVWVMVSAFGLAMATIWLPDQLNSMALGCGGLLTIILVFIGAQARLMRLQAAAIVPLAVGILAAFYGLGDILGAAAVFFASGLTLLATGLVGRGSFLRMHPRAG